MNEAGVPWWAAVARDSPEVAFARCPTCNVVVDSVEVVCVNDDTSLLGTLASERSVTLAVYVLRALVVAAALAVGYAGWIWPAYVVGVALALGFALLFLRNHRSSLIYLATAGAVVAIGHWIWVAMHYSHSTAVLWSFLIAALLGHLAFTIGLSVHSADERSFPSDLSVTVRTIVIACAGMTTTVAIGVVILLGQVYPNAVPAWLLWISMHGAPVTISAALLAILASSIAYTLAAPSFRVNPIVAYRELLLPVEFARLRVTPKGQSLTQLEQVAATIERVLVSFANGITAAVESAYNGPFRSLINGAGKMVIEWLNATYRWIVKVGRHIARTLERSAVVASRCARWAWALSRRFMTAFAGPVALTWLACAELWWIAEEVRGYVLHEKGWATPLVSLVRIVFVVIILSASAMLMLRVRAASFGGKLSAAAASLGGRAFLFFVLIAWSLGILGWLTGGPYRVGWVTLASTSVIVASLVVLRARRPVTVLS